MTTTQPRSPFDPSKVKVPTENILTVSELTGQIKRAMATGFPDRLTVRGQLSNCKQHSSGHLYATLKDPRAQLPLVMWTSDLARVKFEIVDGLDVQATGRLDVYEPHGRYQFYVDRLQPHGLGALELAFRQLVEKLRGEGLFDPDRKQPLPRFPENIGIVTSPTGAAIRDIVTTAKRRWRGIRLLLSPVAVQGELAAPQIARAIAWINRHQQRAGGIDVLIVGRGGGSLEDLWAFNDERVARAIFASKIPVISAVGHEVDTTIADLVADVRAATPTAAAEIAIPSADELLQVIAAQQQRLMRALQQHHRYLCSQLERFLALPLFRRPLDHVRQFAQHVDDMQGALARALHNHARDLIEQWNRLRARLAAEHPKGRLTSHTTSVELTANQLHKALSHRLALARNRLRVMERSLSMADPTNVLNRGYSITRLKKGRAIVKSTSQLNAGQKLLTTLIDGEVESVTSDPRQGELFGE